MEKHREPVIVANPALPSSLIPHPLCPQLGEGEQNCLKSFSHHLERFSERAKK